MFATSIRVHHRLIFVCKGKSLPLEWCLVRGYALVGCNITCKYQIRVEVTDNDKHSSSLQYVKNYGSEKFIVMATGVNVSDILCNNDTQSRLSWGVCPFQIFSLR